MRRLAIAAAALACLCAQAPAPEQWAEEIETVTVTGAAKSPPVWRVRRGDGEVWILGTVGPMPETLVWNKASMAALVRGAHTLLLPPQPDVGLVDAAWFYLWHGDLLRQPRGQTLEASLPRPLQDRFAAARALAGQDADRYASDVPLVAAMRLQRDFNDARHLSRREPRRSVEDQARRAGLKITRMGSFDLMPTVRAVLALDGARQQPCLDQAVGDIDRQAANASAAAEAWADGDVAAIKAHYAETRVIECVTAASQQAAAINALSVDLIVRGLDGALKQKGKSVTVIGIGPLLRRDGVLEKLAALGASIDHPG